MQQRKALGQGMGGLGLAALVPVRVAPESLGTEAAAEAPSSPLQIEIDKIIPNRYQPRQKFDQAALLELAKSIKSHGLIQPIVVRVLSEPPGGADSSALPLGKYELIAGERRLRASAIAGFLKIPAIIMEIDDHAMMEYALLENIQREELNPIEKASAYSRLMTEFSLTQEMIAEKIGIDRSSVANTVRLLQLPESLWGDMAEGSISMGHAKVLLSLATRALQLQVAGEIKSRQLSVRQLETVVKGLSKKGKTGSKKIEGNGVEIQNLERRLQQSLGTKVRITAHGKGKGIIKMEYYSLDDLDRILEKLTRA